MARPAQLQADRGNPRLKFLDRYVGIPVVAALSLGRRVRGVRPVPAHWKTVGILLTAGIGDTVVASGVMHDLRTSRPDVRIVLFVTANNAAFARLLTDPDAVVELPVRRIPTAVRMVRDEECDVIVDLSPWRRYDAGLDGRQPLVPTVRAALNGTDRQVMIDLAAALDKDNNLGCPLS